MITVVDNRTTRDGLHCTAYPSPSALEACAICQDKFRMEQMVHRENNGEYESSEDAKRGTAIHKACAILLITLINSTESSGSNITKRVLYTSSVDILNKIAGWDNSYYDLAYRAVMTVYAELFQMEKQHGSVTVYIETLVDLDKFLNGYYGTADVIAVAGDEMLVADYKFGFRKISAIKNKQLVCYASAYLNGVKNVKLMIVQPSIGHRSIYASTASDIKHLMVANLMLIKNVSDTSVIHSKCVSDGSCTYCTAKNACAAYKTSTFGKILNALTSDKELSDEERAELYMMVNAAENWKKNNRDAIVSSIEAGKCDGYYLKRNKDRVTVDSSKTDDAVEATGRDKEDLILFGALDYSWKIDIEKMKEYYGADFDKKFGRFLKVSKGNVVIKRRDDDGHDA